MIFYLAAKIRRIARNIEIEWDGKRELATYADRPLDEVLEEVAKEMEEEEKERLAREMEGN